MSNGTARNRVVLVVLDGWGYRSEREGNAIELASTPIWHRLWDAYPRTLLDASGLAVGLPKGQMGNSEVGHLNLGAGRVVPQDLVRISQSIQSGEFYALLMWGTVGMMMMAKGLDLLIIVLGLELLSICIFILVGFHRRIAVSNEASLKYFLMGAFATGFVLYGTALFYGATGSTNFAAFSRYFATADASNPLLTIAFILLMSGLGFKLAVAPFHGWAPDVYQGAPSPIAGWISTAPKAATLIALVRIFASMTPVIQQASWMKMVAS